VEGDYLIIPQPSQEEHQAGSQLQTINTQLNTDLLRCQDTTASQVDPKVTANKT